MKAVSKEGVQEAGVWSSGVLHRILAHKAAVYFTEGGGGGYKGIYENIFML